MLLGAVTKVNRLEHGCFGFGLMPRIAPLGVTGRKTRARICFWELPRAGINRRTLFYDNKKKTPTAAEGAPTPLGNIRSISPKSEASVSNLLTLVESEDA